MEIDRSGNTTLIIFGLGIMLMVAMIVSQALAQNVTVDGVSLDEEQQAQYVQAQEQRTGDFKNIKAESARVLKFLEVRAVPVIDGPEEQAKVDDAIFVVRAITKRLLEAKAAEEVTGVEVKRASLKSRNGEAGRRLIRILNGSEYTQVDIDAAEIFAEEAQTALAEFEAAHPVEG